MAPGHVSTGGDYSDLASGSVLRSAPGYPAYPVRLASEIFARSLAHLPARPLTLWDPCCGSGYLLTVLGLLHRDRLGMLVATDVAPAAIELASRNLELLTEAGLRARAIELRARETQFQKPGYGAAAEAADRLARQLRAAGGDLRSLTGTADVFDETRLRAALAGQTPDLVVTDVPYGQQTGWLGAAPGTDQLPALARSICAVLEDDAILAISAQARKISLGSQIRVLERIRHGNRAVAIARVADLRDAVAG